MDKDTDVKVLYESDEHKFLLLGWKENGEEGAIQTNQYAIVDGNEAVLLDPGGVHVFPRVLSNISEVVPVDKIKAIFYTHQDPDVSSGISLWLSSTNANVYISNLWVRFLPHFGVFDFSKVKGIEDKGGTFKFASGRELKFIPAHFLHSVGNFILYDPSAKILFSGDIGASVFPEGERYIFVENFQKHLNYIEGFHKRYMTSHEACKELSERMKKLDIEIMAPQHGALYKRENVSKFFDWFEKIKCGVDILNEIWG